MSVTMFVFTTDNNLSYSKSHVRFCEFKKRKYFEIDKHISNVTISASFSCNNTLYGSLFPSLS